MAWLVGRDDAACYIEQRDGDAVGGEQSFASEAEATAYALSCEEAAIEPLRASIRRLRARLRKITPHQHGGKGA